MRQSYILSTLVRSPLRTLLTFIILAAVTFALFAQTVQHTIISREFTNAAKQYVGVGTVEVERLRNTAFFGLDSINRSNRATLWPQYIYADSRMADLIPEDVEWYRDYMGINRVGTLIPNEFRYKPLTQEQVAAISLLPYISFSETRYMTAGVSDSYYRLDEDYEFNDIVMDGDNYYYNYTARAVIEATLSEIRTDYRPFYVESFNHLWLEDAKLLAGNVPWMEPRTHKTKDGDMVEYAHESLIVYAHDRIPIAPIGISGYSRIAWVGTPGYWYNTSYIEGLELGKRYVFVLRFEPLHTSFIAIRDSDNYEISHWWELVPAYMLVQPGMILYDHLTEEWCPAIWPLDEVSEGYLEREEYSPLRELMEITETDIRTLDTVYVEDMRSIMRFAMGDMVIAEGRALTREDSAEYAEVCVISMGFATVNGLAVGDMIRLKLGTELFAQFKGLGAVAAARERYSPAEQSVDLEIVGIYADTDSLSRQSTNPQWCYSVSTVFVPNTLIPVSADMLNSHEPTPSEFSFMVEDAWSIPDFLSEALPIIESMGLSLVFEDGGWSQIANTFQTAEQAAIIRITVVIIATAVATYFAIYLFIARKRKDYATMRALGVPRNSAATSLLFPLMTIAGVAALVGGTAGWAYVNGTVSRNNTLSELEGHMVSLSIPTPVSLVCISGIIILTFLIALCMLHNIGNHPPLELLREAKNSRRQTSK